MCFSKGGLLAVQSVSKAHKQPPCAPERSCMVSSPRSVVQASCTNEGKSLLSFSRAAWKAKKLQAGSSRLSKRKLDVLGGEGG